MGEIPHTREGDLQLQTGNPSSEEKSLLDPVWKWTVFQIRIPLQVAGKAARKWLGPNRENPETINGKARWAERDLKKKWAGNWEKFRCQEKWRAGKPKTKGEQENPKQGKSKTKP